MKLLKKLKQKRCEKCIHRYKDGVVDCCYRKYKNTGFKALYPLKLFCLNYKRK